MQYYDRLYGKLKFPPVVQELLSCPGLLRLRDVRMANNQFAAFPAFANTSRYEHSLGVCYLAGISAKALELSEKDTTELMIACLYHDVGTPPYAHAMEEVLQAHCGFDHEENLKSIIIGTNESFEGNLEQIYFDCAIKLQSVCHSKRGRSAGLNVYSPYRIANIIAGDKKDPLAPLLCGNGMDLDNIDNIVRASSAMGILRSEDLDLPQRLANAYRFDEGKVCFDACYMSDIRKWQKIREEQYSAIFESVDDFAYQTMIKKAISLLMNDANNEYRLSRQSWKLTDSEILYNYLLKTEDTRKIMERVQLCKPYQCLGILYISGDNTSKYLNNHLADIEKAAATFLTHVMRENENADEVRKVENDVVAANYYPDKRKRKIYEEAIFYGSAQTIDQAVEGNEEAALLGLFTPLYSLGYRNDKSVNGRKVRRHILFKEENLREMIAELKRSVLEKYDVSIYGRKTDEGSNTEIGGNQLGLF